MSDPNLLPNLSLADRTRDLLYITHVGSYEFTGSLQIVLTP